MDFTHQDFSVDAGHFTTDTNMIFTAIAWGFCFLRKMNQKKKNNSNQTKFTTELDA